MTHEEKKFSRVSAPERSARMVETIYGCKWSLTVGIIDRVAYPEIPPRVEYKLTAFRMKFIRILDELEELQREIETNARLG